ncbi:alpha/beta hydrolase [Pseudonocardia humida]|uniref:Alpha/beta hydrolase n=1 Tax=Pseudonocardia humida TaxID=2800819 RepID=A0ABT1AA76_9PSEU|nr:alpha/beta hydrolase [Pseudonocardia humida]MCO1659908.1 alpha/beta hydrolase [Pseudonocardia humida]
MSSEQRAKVDAIMRAPQPVPRDLGEMRAAFAARQALSVVPEAIGTSETVLGTRRALVLEPADQQPRGTILYFHGGAWALGSPETSLSLTAHLVSRSRSRAFSLDYRLAPEHPFPAAIHDGVDAYRALLDDGVDPGHIAFAGDSAGGGLAVTTVMEARERGLPVPGAIVAFSPSLDLTLTSASMGAKEGVDPIFTRERLRPFVAMYCPGADVRQPLLSPAVSGDLTGFPPMLLQAGSHEVLLDDAVVTATRAVSAGVDVLLDVTAGVPHVFQNFVGLLDEADQALDRAALFLRHHGGTVQA